MSVGTFLYGMLNYAISAVHPNATAVSLRSFLSLTKSVREAILAAEAGDTDMVLSSENMSKVLSLFNRAEWPNGISVSPDQKQAVISVIDYLQKVTTTAST